jgi:tRNA(Ile)-lysidine synthase
MLDRLAKFADKYDMLPREGAVLAAVSGGADSMCLLAALLELSPARGFSVVVAHYNHRLRGDESDRDACFDESFCRERDVPLYKGSGDVRVFARSERLGIEEAARRMRYEFLYETAKNIDAKRIATAHTADDNAETVLLNLTRGAGLKGLGGIPPRRGIVIRPILAVTREEVLDFLSKRCIPFVEDSSNALDIYGRNMIRHRVIPVLKELNPRFCEHVSVTTSLIRDDEAYINDIAKTYVRTHYKDSSLEVSSLLKLPSPVGSRVIRHVYGNNLSAGHISAILALCASDDVSGEVALPSGTVYREYNRIVFVRETETTGFSPVEITAGSKTEIPELGLTVSAEALMGQKKLINHSLLSSNMIDLW